MKELEVVALTRDIPESRLKAGDVGTIVFVHGDAEAFEVEFVTEGGETLAVQTLFRGDVRPLRSTDILNAREVA